MKIIDSVSYYKDNFPMPKTEAISQKPTSQPFQVDLRPSSFMLGDRKVGPLRQASHLSVVEWVFLLFPGAHSGCKDLRQTFLHLCLIVHAAASKWDCSVEIGVAAVTDHVVVSMLLLTAI
jgi:hypothetical protein